MMTAIRILRTPALMLSAIVLLQACQAVSTSNHAADQTDHVSRTCLRKVLAVDFSNPAFAELSSAQRQALHDLKPDLLDAPMLVLTGRARARSVSASEERSLALVNAVATDLIAEGIGRARIRRSVDLFRSGNGVDVAVAGPCSQAPGR